MDQNIKNYIKSLSSDKKKRIYSLRRTARITNLCYFKYKKCDNCFKVCDLNEREIFLFPFIDNSVFKTFFIMRIFLEGIEEYLANSYHCNYFFRITISLLKKLFLIMVLI